MTGEAAGSDLRRRTVRRVAVVVLVGLLLGALGGVVWEWLWTPPTGAAYQGKWLPDPQGISHVADGTAWFVVVGLTYGILYGTFTTRYARGLEVATMLALAVGALLAAWATIQVGGWLGPADASEAARTTGDLEPLLLDLHLSPSSAGWWPGFMPSPVAFAPAIGALMSAVVMYLCTNAPGETRWRRRRVSSDAQPEA